MKLRKILLVAWMSLIFSATAFADTKTVILTWEHDIPTDLAGYEVWLDSAVITNCRAQGTKIDIPYVAGMPLTKDITITSPAGQEVIWHVRMTAYDTSGNVSACSVEATVKIDFLGPGIPRNVKLVIKTVP